MGQGWTLFVDDRTPGAGERLAPLADVLAERLGDPVRLSPVTDVAGALDSAVDERLIGWLGYRDVVEVVRRSTATPVAMVQYEGDPFYRSMILTRPDLAGRRWPEEGGGCRLWLGPHFMLAGWVAPVAALRAQGVEPAAFFDLREASLDAGVAAMLSGDGDYAVTYNRALRKSIEADAVGAADFALAWASEPLPYDAIVASDRLDAPTRERLRTTLLSLKASDVARLPAGYTGFSYAAAQDYVGVQRMMEAAA